MLAKSIPQIGHQILQSTAMPIIIPSSGSMAANGAVTLTTALPNTYPDIYLYFPANKVYAGSAAGFYYAIMSSTTAGTVYDNIYVPGTNLPNIPASPTPIVAAGPGAYTQSTSEITAVSVNVVGGSMGKNGIVKIEATIFVNNSANTKTVKWKFGAMQINFMTAITINRALGRVAIINRGRIDRQTASYLVDGANTINPPVFSIDTATDQALNITLQLTVATDYLGMDYFFTELLPKK